jgi:CheY-like chemotaxis protein
MSGSDLLQPRVLIVDDERQIHASIRLRIGNEYALTCCTDARSALARISEQQFDLCFADIHMPNVDGIKFIEEAQKLDPQLGYVILSAFDTDENLRRSIPLQVFAFIPKPLPDREGFETQIEDWVLRTRDSRRRHALTKQAASLAGDLDAAKLEREVELVASETARDALLQTVNLLTTIHAHLVTCTAMLAARAKGEPSLIPPLRNLEEAKKAANAAVSVGEEFFGSAYGNRDTSPAIVDTGLRQAADIASRMCKAADRNLCLDIEKIDDRTPLRTLTGIDFLLLSIPLIGAALTLSPPNSTLRVTGSVVQRIDVGYCDSRFRRYLWFNRRSALISHPGVRLDFTTSAAPFSVAGAEDWLNNCHAPLARITTRGLVMGLQKSKGLFAIAVAPAASHFHAIVLLPV